MSETFPSYYKRDNDYLRFDSKRSVFIVSSSHERSAIFYEEDKDRWGVGSVELLYADRIKMESITAEKFENMYRQEKKWLDQLFMKSSQLRIARLTKNLNQAYVAKILGLQQSEYSQIETGKRKISDGMMKHFVETIQAQ